MEYAKDEIFNIHYNEEKDRLEIGESENIWKQLLGKSKFFKIITILTVVLSVFNMVCICNFYTLFSQFK